MLHLLMATTLLSFWGSPPLSMHAVLPLLPVHAATQPASGILWCGAPVEVAPWGRGVGMDPACSINALSKQRGICTFPRDVTRPRKCSGFPVSSSVEHRESCSDPSDQVTVSEFIPRYENDHHPDPSMPFQSWFLSRETNFQLSDPVVSLAGSAGQP